MTSRRWFWFFIAAGAVWSFAGTHWNVQGMSTAQEKVAAQPVNLLLTPGTFVFGSVQTAVSTAVRGRGVRDGHQGESTEELRAQLRAAEDALVQERAWNKEYQSQLAAFHQLQSAGIEPETVLQATVLGRQSGIGTSTLTLDKGGMDGVTKDSPVIVPVAGDAQTTEGVTLLGRVETVLEKQSIVRLLSDPASKVRIQIVRPTIKPAADSKITTEPILAYGLGSNAMDIRDLNVDPAKEPQRGDLVQLIDNSFPPKAQYMVIGQIDDVGRRSDNALRYELHVTPRVAVTSLHTVMILMK